MSPRTALPAAVTAPLPVRDHGPSARPVSRTPSSRGEVETAASLLTPNPVALLRRTLLAAIRERIAEMRLTAAQAAALLHLTGPKITRLLAEDADEFTVEELICLLPEFGLAINVVREKTPVLPA